MWRSGLVKQYNAALCTLPLDLTSRSGFATGCFLDDIPPLGAFLYLICYVTSNNGVLIIEGDVSLYRLHSSFHHITCSGLLNELSKHFHTCINSSMSKDNLLIPKNNAFSYTAGYVCLHTKVISSYKHNQLQNVI